MRRLLPHVRFVTQLLWVAVQAAVLLASGFAGTVYAQEAANGVFLVARPEMNDRTFRRTVILVTQPAQSGPMGVIVNRPTAVTLAEVMPVFKQLSAQTQKLHFGGPVQRRNLVFLVRTATPPPRAVAILRDVYMTTDADWVEASLSDSASQLDAGAVRVYAGYTGWARGQLDYEMEREGWYIVPADSEYIFDRAPNEIWGELVKRAVLPRTRYDFAK